jgi:ribosomal protein S15P/S13E
MKKLFFISVIVLSGCATQASQAFDRSDMVGFKPDCGQAKSQVAYLQTRIDAYNAHFESRPKTLEDRRYYGKLKNSIWSVRSSCSALQR